MSAKSMSCWISKIQIKAWRGKRFAELTLLGSGIVLVAARDFLLQLTKSASGRWEFEKNKAWTANDMMRHCRQILASQFLASQSSSKDSSVSET